MAALAPDKVAFDPRHQVSHAELQRQVDRCALGLLELGVRPGDVVILPAPELDRVDRRPLCGDPYRGDQQPLILIYRERKLGFMVGLARSTGLVVPSEFRASITPE